MKRLILLMLALLPLVGAAQTNVPGGNVSGTWTAAASPYRIQGSIRVPADSMLLIQAGTTVIFQGHYKFLVEGRMLALGSATANVVFTAANPSSGWLGIRIEYPPASNDSSIFDYCAFWYGKGADPVNNGGVMAIYGFSRVRVSHCLFRENSAPWCGGAMDVSSCDPVITQNTFSGNSVNYQSNMLNGGGALCLYQSDATVTGNTFSGNHAGSGVGGGGAIFIQGGHPLIDRNTIINNSSTNDTFFNEGGGGAIFADGDATISNNTISNNTANGYIGRGGAIYLYWNTDAVIFNNTITNNTATGSEGIGGALFCLLNCNPYLTNNTIAHNHSLTSGGGLYCSSGSSPQFRNCILYGNTASADTNQVYLLDEQSDPHFYYCDIQGGMAGFELNGNFYNGDYEHNISLNPRFQWPSPGSGSGFNGVVCDWTENTASPCINAGDPALSYPLTDKAGNPRIVNGCVDIGAFEYQWMVGFGDRPDFPAITCSPNPCRDRTNLRFDGPITRGKIELRDRSGRTVRTVYGVNGAETVIDKGDLPAGCYTIILSMGNRPVKIGTIIFTD